MTFTEAAAEVLRLVGRPLHYKEITAYAIEKSFLSHVGKSPEVTMGARLAALFKKNDDENPMIRVRPGVFALKQWEESGQLKDMVAKLKPTARTVTAPEETKESVAKKTTTTQQSAEPSPTDAGDSVVTPSDSEPPRPTSAFGKADEKSTASSTDPDTSPSSASADASESADAGSGVDAVIAPIRRRTRVVDIKFNQTTTATSSDDVIGSDAVAVAAPADALATRALNGSSVAGRGTSVDAQVGQPVEVALSSDSHVDDDDDDDNGASGVDGAERESSRRRRRRRRRPAKSDNNGVAYSAVPADSAEQSRESASDRVASGVAPLPVVIDVSGTSTDTVSVEDAAGKNMADVIAAILSADRAAGPQSLRQLAETCQRRARTSVDSQQLQSQIAAAVRADDLRRQSMGARPRFRFAGGRISLNDWLLNGDLARMEQEAQAAVQRYCDAARKVFVKKIQELPPHAFLELVLLTLERIGLRCVRASKRSGISGNEAHFTGLFDTGAGQVQAALVVRRDAREIGRDRVSELRGALHHYGPASMGWLVTAGTVLFGAREEAATASAAPIFLYDGNGIARLCEQFDIAVVRATMPICIPDLDVLEALRSS